MSFAITRSQPACVIFSLAFFINSCLDMSASALNPTRKTSFWIFLILFIIFGTFFIFKEILDKRSEEHTSDSSHPSISYAVFCLKKKKKMGALDTAGGALVRLEAGPRSDLTVAERL